MLTEVDSTRAFRYQWYFWRCIGLHPPAGDSFWARHYRAWSIVVNVLPMICVPLSFYMECLHSRSLTAFCEAFYLAAITFVQQMKMINVIRVRGHLLELHGIMRQLDGRLQSTPERQAIRDKIDESEKICLHVLRLFLLVVLSGCCFAAWSAERELPFVSWTPWDYQKSQGIYALTFAVQSVAILILALISASSDTYPLVYLIMVAAHCKALALRIAKLGHNALSQEQTHQQLLACIQDHQTILQLLNILNTSMSSACVIQFVCTAISLCTLSFIVIYIEMSFLRLFHASSLLTSITIETLVICYASEQVTHEGEQMANAIYDTNWIDQPVRFRRTLVIMLMRSQRPICIVAGNILPVRMTTLLSVIKGAYTMFTLLNEAKSRN
ncbi:PREDICTED: putative odorant receptor 19b [Drosophila arizonae]|uniref:Odorant receptor n=1 Tax=Drosophila arizonae TaxID=7263 RepID=A0ABM1PRE5_DROAR|nr:PREDICTED: putative odorant receptor 19b [Drosophila arizonae]